MANEMMGRLATTDRVVVIARNAADSITDTLDALAEQISFLEIPDLQVVVVDQESTDGTADVAIHHPLPGRVMVVADGSLQRAINAGSREAQRLLVLSAHLRPEPGWVAAGLRALADAPVALGPDDPDLGSGLHNLAIDLRYAGHISLFASTDDRDEVRRRARHAGLRVETAPGMAVGPARPTPAVPGPLPVLDPPAAGPGHVGRLSVVLCTKDRPDHLARCLASLARLADDDHEIVVVDNHAVPVVDPGDLPARACLVHEPTAGLDAARNRGLAESTGEVVAYVDDDCEVDPHWLTALRSSFADPHVGMVTGRVRPATLSTQTQRSFESQFTFDRGFIRRRFTRWDERPWYPLWTGPLGTGCNMAFRRAALHDVGGFDELLDVGSSIGGGGDLDVFARLLDRGVTAEYAPDALVWHHHRDTTAGLRKQFRGYGEATGAYLMKAFLERPGLRLAAVRYFGSVLVARLRAVRDIRQGRRVVSMPLVATFVVGQLVGPFLYLRARRSATRAARAR